MHQSTLDEWSGQEGVYKAETKARNALVHGGNVQPDVQAISNRMSRQFALTRKWTVGGSRC